jgi:hypothetical protein
MKTINVISSMHHKPLSAEKEIGRDAQDVVSLTVSKNEH